MAFQSENGAGRLVCPSCGRDYPNFVGVCTRCNVSLRTGQKIADSVPTGGDGSAPNTTDVRRRRRPVSRPLVAVVVVGAAVYWGEPYVSAVREAMDDDPVAAPPDAPQPVNARPAGPPPTATSESSATPAASLGAEPMPAVGANVLASVDFSKSRSSMPAGADLILTGDDEPWYTDFSLTLPEVAVASVAGVSVRLYGVRGAPAVAVQLDGLPTWRGTLSADTSCESPVLFILPAVRARGAVAVTVEIRRGAPRELSGARGFIVVGR